MFFNFTVVHRLIKHFWSSEIHEIFSRYRLFSLQSFPTYPVGYILGRPVVVFSPCSLSKAGFPLESVKIFEDLQKLVQLIVIILLKLYAVGIEYDVIY